MTIGNVKIDCAVLADETRVISDRGVSKAMGGKRGGSHWKRIKEGGALILPPYISANNLRPFIPNDLIYILTNPIQYKTTKIGAIGNAIMSKKVDCMYVTWANISSQSVDGVERYLFDLYTPLVGERAPNVRPITVNLPE